jgi:predicted lipoprotein
MGISRRRSGAPVGSPLMAAGILIALGSVSLAIACGTDSPRERFARSNPTPRPSRAAAAASADAAAMRDAAAGLDAATDANKSSDASAAAAMLDVRAACGAPPVLEGEFSRERLRTAAAECAMWRYCGFRTAAGALDEAVTAYASDRNQSTLQIARSAWRDAMDQWSESELFQFGPAASVAQSAGKDMYQGKGLRDRIYSWPTTAQCRIEEQILAQPRSLDGVLISGRGLYALEYSLFHSGGDSACAASTETGKAWAALAGGERDARTASYAKTIAADVRAQSEALVDAWSPAGGNFKQTFVSATGYPDEQTALTVMGWALIYVEKEVKDWKLGIPAGYTLTSPVSGPETPFAKVATQNIQANLRGFRALFQGCGEHGDGLGFDDWLREAGHGELADQLLEALNGAEKAIDQLGPLHEASKEKLESTYQALRKLTDLLKSDLFGAGSPLNLKLPASVEGDTD